MQVPYRTFVRIQDLCFLSIERATKYNNGNQICQNKPQTFGADYLRHPDATRKIKKGGGLTSCQDEQAMIEHLVQNTWLLRSKNLEIMRHVANDSAMYLTVDRSPK